MVAQDLYSISPISEIMTTLGVSSNVAILLLTIILVWSLTWKGLALWKAAKKNQSIWFIVILVMNTIGILEILYIFVFSKMDFSSKSKSSSSKSNSKKKK